MWLRRGVEGEQSLTLGLAQTGLWRRCLWKREGRKAGECWDLVLDIVLAVSILSWPFDPETLTRWPELVCGLQGMHAVRGSEARELLVQHSCCQKPDSTNLQLNDILKKQK